MNQRKKNDIVPGGLCLIFCLLGLSQIQAGHPPCKNNPWPEIESVFVAVSGDVARPGTYGFTHGPNLQRLVQRAGGLGKKVHAPDRLMQTPIVTGKRVHVGASENGCLVFEEDMSAFHKKALRIPISINGETREGLTAIPGIGFATAGAIVSERQRRHGFRSLDELLTVHGVGPGLYDKIKPFIIL